jgi:LL-diaminopimelate aminotransferase
MTPEPAQRISRLPPYIFAELEALQEDYANRGVRLTSFGIGDPDLPPVKEFMTALYEALSEEGFHNYSSSAGERFFRLAVSEWYYRRFGVNVDPDREVCALIGSKEGIANVGRAYLNPGDRALVPNPGYPVYAQGATILSDAEAEDLDLSAETGFQPDFESIRLTGREKLLFLNYPSNPTGAMASERTLKEAVHFCHEHDMFLCYDNAYSETAYERRALSPLEFDHDKRNVVEFNSCSKMFSVTGFRVGFAVGNERAINLLKKIKSQIDSGVPKFIQRAAAMALDRYFEPSFQSELAERRSVYGRRLEVLVRGLKSLGYAARVPEATFYLWLNAGKDGSQFAKELMAQGVVVTPGGAFGSNGRNYVRFAVTQPEEVIRECLERLNS